MRMRKKITAVAALAVGSLLGWLAASGSLSLRVHADETQRAAQAVGSSSVLPIPSEPFKGTINLRAKDSKSDFPQPVQAPKGAPNVLLVLLDRSLRRQARLQLRLRHGRPGHQVDQDAE